MEEIIPLILPPCLHFNLCYDYGMRNRRIVSSPKERFWNFVEKTDKCWIWKGANNGMGYGKFYTGPPTRKKMYAHRFSYELINGEIPLGFQLDHLCKNPPCVRPEHLEAVTPRVNIIRGEAGGIWKQICVRGHDMSKSCKFRSTDGRRVCVKCNVIRTQEWRKKQILITSTSLSLLKGL